MENQKDKIKEEWNIVSKINGKVKKNDKEFGYLFK